MTVAIEHYVLQGSKSFDFGPDNEISNENDNLLPHGESKLKHPFQVYM